MRFVNVEPSLVKGEMVTMQEIADAASHLCHRIASGQIYSIIQDREAFKDAHVACGSTGNFATMDDRDDLQRGLVKLLTSVCTEKELKDRIQNTINTLRGKGSNTLFQRNGLPDEDLDAGVAQELRQYISAHRKTDDNVTRADYLLLVVKELDSLEARCAVIRRAAERMAEAYPRSRDEILGTAAVLPVSEMHVTWTITASREIYEEVNS